MLILAVPEIRKMVARRLWQIHTVRFIWCNPFVLTGVLSDEELTKGEHAM
jgi:hypothetical protein